MEQVICDLVTNTTRYTTISLGYSDKIQIAIKKYRIIDDSYENQYVIRTKLSIVIVFVSRG